MSGYPTIITRDAFGPTREDDGIPPDDSRYVGAYHFNLLFHQVAGMNIAAARAYVLLAFASGVASIVERGEAWAPNGDGAAPTLTKVGTGHWTLEYASTYANQQGAQAGTSFRWAVGHAQGSFAVAATSLNNPQTVRLDTLSFSGSNADPPDGTNVLVLVS